MSDGVISKSFNPELGNIVFGCSRGEYSLNRDAGVEEEIIRLCEALEPNHDNSWRDVVQW